MSKKYILNSADKTLSPSQVYLEKLSSGVFRDLFSSGSCGYNNLLQREEAKKSPKRSPFKRPKTKVKCGATFAKRKAPSTATKKVRLPEGVGKPAQTNHVFSGSSSTLPKPASYVAVVGNAMEITSPGLPKLRETCIAGSSRTKAASTHRAAIAREVDGAKKLCILSAVKPTNVDTEKVKFFKSGFSYNPQFEYSNPVSSLALARHNNASDRFLTQVSLGRLSSESGELSVAPPEREEAPSLTALCITLKLVRYLRSFSTSEQSDESCEPLQAVHIMELVLQRYGSFEAFQQVTGGGLLTRSRIWHNVKKYMEKEGCLGEVGRAWRCRAQRGTQNISSAAVRGRARHRC